MTTLRKYFSRYFELSVWITALILLSFMSPVDSHASLCPLNALDIGFCPGCGLGHSISWLFHGDLTASFRSHPLGVAAFLIILFRIVTLLRYNFTSTYNTN